MGVDGWRYYNHAMIPTTAPHEKPNLTPVKNGEVWKAHGKSLPLLIRWTTEYDCGYETEWWYCIKDTPFDINNLKSKRRYEINKGKKFFFVKVIEPNLFKDEIYEVAVKAFSVYPDEYRPDLKKEEFVNVVSLNWGKYITFGAFSLENKLEGYACLEKNVKCYDFKILKSNPEKEKHGINAVIINEILSYLENEITNGAYICDGARSIMHKTMFQDYLEKYFGFRKAYCRLNIEYRLSVKCVIKLLYPMQGLLLKFDNWKIIHKINSLLYMEKLRRTFEKKK